MSCLRVADLESGISATEDDLSTRRLVSHAQLEAAGYRVALVARLDFGELPKLGIPIRLEHARHMTVVWVDVPVSSLGKLRLVTGVLHLLAAELIDLFRPAAKFVVY